MADLFKKIVNVETGEEVEKKLTKEELEQYKKDQKEYEEFKVKEEEIKANKLSAYKKLGLTDEEIAAII